MRYLPILQELFESDSLLFLVLGLAGAYFLFLGTVALGCCIGLGICILTRVARSGKKAESEL